MAATDVVPAPPACGAALLAALAEARDEASRQQAEVDQARAEALAAKQAADRATAALEHLRAGADMRVHARVRPRDPDAFALAERDALATAVDAFSGAMQTNIKGVEALAQLNSERQRAEELERTSATNAEKAAACKAALDAATETHGREMLRAQAAHADQVQKLEGALETTKAEAQELREGIASLEAELARRSASTGPVPGGGGGNNDSASHQVAALKAKLMAARQEADAMRKGASGDTRAPSMLLTSTPLHTCPELNGRMRGT